MADQSPLIRFLIKYQKALIQTDLVRDLWMIPERLTGEYFITRGEDVHFEIATSSPMYVGKLFVHGTTFYAIKSFEKLSNRRDGHRVFSVSAENTEIPYNPNATLPLCTPQDVFILQPGQIDNYVGSDPVETTIGIFVANYLFLVYPFGDKIAYLNEEFSSSKLEKRIAIPFLDGRITTGEVKDRYINTLSLFGQSNEIISPGISEKTITPPKSIQDLLQRLVKENKAALEAGDASVMSDIEKQLITAYKDYLKGDPSLHFLLKKKYFDVTLKKLFLTQGMTEVFGSPGKFTFIANPMGNGWKVENLPDIFNEVRSGSYSRAIETANGGVIAKLILRVFQDTRITIDDCQTVRGETVTASPDTLREFQWNYVINPDGSTTLLTDETIPNYTQGEVVVRTPGYCQSPQGFCAKCFGRIFEVLGQKAFAPVANDFARTQTTLSLKSMHGKSHSVVDVNDVNRYLVNV